MVFKPTLLAVYIVLLSLSVFGQNISLSLDPSDIRFELAFENESPVGYNLFVRKKPDIESVMLTEPTGNYALRLLWWDAINRNEKREFSGVTLTDDYSRFNILSSTSIPDRLFVEAFQLFVPLWVVYGDPSSPKGTVYMNIKEGVQINVRTFDHKYGDPNTGRFQNNLTLINTSVAYVIREPLEPQPVQVETYDPNLLDLSNLKNELYSVVFNKKFVEDMPDADLRRFLRKAFLDLEEEYEQHKNR